MQLREREGHFLQTAEALSNSSVMFFARTLPSGAHDMGASDLSQMAMDWPLCLIFGCDIFQQSNSAIPSSVISRNIYIKRPFPS